VGEATTDRGVPRLSKHSQENVAGRSGITTRMGVNPIYFSKKIKLAYFT